MWDIRNFLEKHFVLTRPGQGARGVLNPRKSVRRAASSNAPFARQVARLLHQLFNAGRRAAALKLEEDDRFGDLVELDLRRIFLGAPHDAGEADDHDRA